jgi:hypothetical protein
MRELNAENENEKQNPSDLIKLSKKKLMKYKEFQFEKFLMTELP